MDLSDTVNETIRFERLGNEYAVDIRYENKSLRKMTLIEDYPLPGSMRTTKINMGYGFEGQNSAFPRYVDVWSGKREGQESIFDIVEENKLVTRPLASLDVGWVKGPIELDPCLFGNMKDFEHIGILYSEVTKRIVPYILKDQTPDKEEILQKIKRTSI